MTSPTLRAPRRVAPELRERARGLRFDGCECARGRRAIRNAAVVFSRGMSWTTSARFAARVPARCPRPRSPTRSRPHNTLAVMRSASRPARRSTPAPSTRSRWRSRAGVPPGDIILNGNGKSDAALEPRPARRPPGQPRLARRGRAARGDRRRGRLQVDCRPGPADLRRPARQRPELRVDAADRRGQVRQQRRNGQAMATSSTSSRADTSIPRACTTTSASPATWASTRPRRSSCTTASARARCAPSRDGSWPSSASGCERLDLGGGFRGRRGRSLDAGRRSDVASIRSRRSSSTPRRCSGRSRRS